ncbi:hypothetical protein DAD99_21020 [Pseudarthrobacter sp. AB1]|nr:hypothetical protein [Pseudarthrobacter sp. AB1]
MLGAGMVAVLALTASGCSGQSPGAPSTASSAATQSQESLASEHATQEPAAEQAPQPPTPTAAPQRGSQPGWPTDNACEAGERYLKSKFAYAPPLFDLKGGKAGSLTCLYVVDGPNDGRPAASFTEGYADPGVNPGYKQVCDLQRSRIAGGQWSPILYEPADSKGWATFDVFGNGTDKISPAICGDSFSITVVLTNFPGATNQDALDFAMAMVNH